MVPIILPLAFILGIFFKRLHFFFFRFASNISTTKAIFLSFLLLYFCFQQYFNSYNKPYYKHREGINDIAEAYYMQRDLVSYQEYDDDSPVHKTISGSTLMQKLSSVYQTKTESMMQPFNWSFGKRQLVQSNVTNFFNKGYASIFIAFNKK